VSLILALALLALALVTVRPVAAAPMCYSTKVNLQGSSGADVTVDATAGGVLVMSANSSRCAALIKNAGANQIRCGPTTQTVTASAYGVVLDAGQVLSLTTESASQAWNCIRTGGSSSSANIVEALP
jgi:hypothetical protein